MLRPHTYHLIPLFLLLVSHAWAVESTPEAPADEPTAVESDAAEELPAEPVLSAEQTLAEALRLEIKDSEFVTLQVEEKEVLALFKQQSRGDALGGVLLLHDLNGHPDWPGVIRTLRSDLPDAGWHSLSLQLPLSDSPKTTIEQLDASRLRITAALAELDKRAIRNIVLIGHGQGGLAAIDYLSDKLPPAVQGLIVIGLDGSINPEPRLDAAAGLGRIAIPILDIYAERDYPNVVRSTKRRYKLSRQDVDKSTKQRPDYSNIARNYTEKRGLSLSYRQIKVSGADHHFSSHTTHLEKRLRGWLDRYAAGIEIE